MSAYVVEAQLRGLALLAEIEMAKAANEARRHQGYADAYGEEAFDDIRNRLEGIANQLREYQLNGGS